MDGILSSAAERQRGRPHGIARTSAWDHVRQRRLVALDLGGWRPGRAQLLAADIGRARPLLADPADADRIAHGLAVAEHVIERPLVGFSPRRCRSNTSPKIRRFRVPAPTAAWSQPARMRPRRPQLSVTDA